MATIRTSRTADNGTNITHTHVVVWISGTGQDAHDVPLLATPDDYVWHRSAPLPRWRADQLRTRFLEDGYRAMVVGAQQSLALGLPETFAV